MQRGGRERPEGVTDVTRTDISGRQREMSLSDQLPGTMNIEQLCRMVIQQLESQESVASRLPSKQLFYNTSSIRQLSPSAGVAYDTVKLLGCLDANASETPPSHSNCDGRNYLDLSQTRFIVT